MLGRYSWAVFAIVGAVAADGFELEVGAITHHWVSKDMNEDNHLIGAGYQRWELSSFINSFGDRSYSASYRWPLPARAFSFSTGVIHGYGESADWFPMHHNGEVLFVTFNVETLAESKVNLRLRLMGDATLLSVVLRPFGPSSNTSKASAKAQSGWLTLPPQAFQCADAQWVVSDSARHATDPDATAAGYQTIDGWPTKRPPKCQSRNPK